MAIDYTTGTLPAEITDHLCEASGSPQEVTTDAGFNATVTLRCKFEHRHQVMDNILGNILEYPRKFNSTAFAQQASCVPDDSTLTTADGQALNYTHAILTINYQQFEIDFGGGGGGAAAVSESLTPNAEFLTQPPTDMKWGSGENAPALKNQEAPGKLILGFDYTQTRYRVNALPTQILTLISHCNQTAVTSSLLGMTFPAETLMFNGTTPTRQLDSRGIGTWTVPLTFVCRPTGWNYFWRTETQKWEQIYLNGKVFKPIPTGNLGLLLV